MWTRPVARGKDSKFWVAAICASVESLGVGAPGVCSMDMEGLAEERRQICRLQMEPKLRWR